MVELLLIPVAIAVPIALRGWHWRVRGDEIDVRDDGTIATPLGTFAYDKTARKLNVAVAGSSASVDVAGPARVVAVPEMKPATLSEALLSVVGVTDFGATDLLPAYRDHDKTVTLVLELGTRQVPLAMLAQYRASDMFDSVGGNNVTRAILSALRAYREIDQVAEARAFEIADALRRQGLDVTS